jgi:hypothetical protein
MEMFGHKHVIKHLYFLSFYGPIPYPSCDKKRRSLVTISTSQPPLFNLDQKWKSLITNKTCLFVHQATEYF